MATFVTKYLRIAGGVAELQQPLRPAGWFSERTTWVGRLTPLRRFVRTETGGAAVLVAAVLAALAWANVGSSYQEVWETPVALTFGDDGIRLSLREWVNSGLMTFFFLVTGLEARREIDLGELRERRRLALPLLAAVGGMAASVAIYLAFNLGGSSGAGWGIALSSDAALGLGLLAVAAPRAPQRLRAFVLTVLVVKRARRAGSDRRPLLPRPRPDRPGMGRGVHFDHRRPGCVRRAQRHPVRVARGRGVGRAARVGRRAGGARPGPGPAGRGPSRRPARAARGRRAFPPVPRAAHAAARALGAAWPARRHPAERAAARPLPPLDELRHRAALCAGQRRGRHRRRAAPARRRIPGDDRCPAGLARRQAARNVRHVARGHPPVKRAATSPGRLGGGHQRGHHHRRRLHRVPAGRRPRVHRSRTRRGQTGPPRRRGTGTRPDLDGDTSDMHHRWPHAIGVVEAPVRRRSRGVAASNPAAGSGSCSHSGIAGGNPGARPRPPRTGRPR